VLLLKITAAISNMAISLLSLYLLGLYGGLHWWYRAARNSGLDSHDLRSAFISKLDQLPLIAVLLCSLAVIGNVALLRMNVVPKSWGLPCLVVSSACLLACLFIRF